MKLSSSWRLVHYRAYAINRRGVIKRVKPAKGTRPGKVLKPFGTTPTVRLYDGQRVKLVHVRDLVKRVWK